MHCEIINCYFNRFFCWNTTEKENLNFFLCAKVWAPKPLYQSPKWPEYITGMYKKGILTMSSFGNGVYNNTFLTRHFSHKIWVSIVQSLFIYQILEGHKLDPVTKNLTSRSNVSLEVTWPLEILYELKQNVKDMQCENVKGSECRKY